MAQINPLTGTSGSDSFVVSGDPFNGVDVSAAGRQVVNQPAQLNDFVIAEDRFVLDATDLGITGESVFVNGSLEELTNSSIANANLVVVQGSFVNAGAAATAIAGTGVASGAGVFVYFNETLQINRLVYSADLGNATADISILGNIQTLQGADAVNALPDFSANNFLLFANTLIGDDNGNELNGTDDRDFIDGRGGRDRLKGNGGSDILTGGPGADTFVFSGDPFDGADVSAPGRQVIANEDFITDFDPANDKYQLNAADFGISGNVSFAAVDATATTATLPAGANVIVLLNSDNDNNPTTPFLAGTAANQIAQLATQDGAGFFLYFNSNLQLNRLVYSTNLNDATADLKVLSRHTNLTGQAAIDALADFSASNVEFQNRLLDTSGGRQIVEVGLGDVLQIKNFGGANRGDRSVRETRQEIDTLKLIGDTLTASNLQLKQTGNDLEVSFFGDDTGTQIVLKDFALEDLENRRHKPGANLNRGNFIFNDESRVEDNLDVFDADSTRNRIFSRNTVTFLNDLNNEVRGFKRSADVINAQGGDDQVWGLSGNDVLRGEEGDDILIGGKGNDWLYGGFGADVLIGDGLTYGGGKDTFVLAPGQGTDVIVDFEIGTDLIGLIENLSFGSLSFAGNTIRFGNEILAQLTGVDTTTLTAESFVQV